MSADKSIIQMSNNAIFKSDYRFDLTFPPFMRFNLAFRSLCEFRKRKTKKFCHPLPVVRSINTLFNKLSTMYVSVACKFYALIVDSFHNFRENCS